VESWVEVSSARRHFPAASPSSWKPRSVIRAMPSPSVIAVAVHGLVEDRVDVMRSCIFSLLQPDRPARPKPCSAIDLLGVDAQPSMNGPDRATARTRVEPV
jgi:hypothetical protein